MKEQQPKSLEDLKSELEIVKKEQESLLKVVSHDLRSPFNKLFALVGLVKMSGDSISEEQLGYLNKMELVISDGLSRMRNLMDLRAVEGAGINTSYNDTDIASLVARVAGDHMLEAERKGIKISFKQTPASIYTDRPSCLRILDQVISNAIKFSPLDSDININLEEVEERVLIHIEDGGYGISDEEQKYLFKKFAELSTRTTAGESSTGIGLYIAQEMAKNIGGKLSYANENGSIFTLSLPKVTVA